MSGARVIVAICIATLALAPTAHAHASLRFESAAFSIYSAPPTASEPGAVGPPEVQAGSHPYEVSIAFSLSQTTDSHGEAIPAGSAKDLQVDLPPGMIGSLVDVPRCPPEAFESGSLFSQGCPAGAQVGTLSLDTNVLDVTLPVVNLEPPPAVAAQLGVFAVLTPVTMGVSVRTGSDYGLTVAMHNLPEFLQVFGGSLKLWGVPADPRHDTLRGSCLGLSGESTGKCSSGAPRKPFLTLPGSCTGPPKATLRIDSWEHPGEFDSETVVPEDPEGASLSLRGCDRLDFSPSMEIRSEDSVADSPSGLSVGLRFPQSENPDGLAEANLRRAVVTLPDGVSVNPAAADGLGACLPSEIGLADPGVPRCPDSSRIGSVQIGSPLLAAPLQGSVYLAKPGSNEFNSMLAVYIAAERDGVLVKLGGRIDADPSTGRLTVTLDDLPQLPFSDLTLRFDGGPRAPLATPPSCGSFTATARLGSYAALDEGAAATPSSDLVVDRGCGGGFSPSFVGGATSSLAARRTGLTLRLARSDGEQALSAFSTTLPRGMLPLLGDIPVCGDLAAADGGCAASSQIGSVTIAAGAGSHPFYLQGAVFLTGPYRGAPFGLSIVVPGRAGPFDLGTIVVRARVGVDPGDARLSIATDPLPQILAGIPLRIRGFDLTSASRPGLFVAPSSCEEQSITGTAFGGTGATASLSSPFFVGGCSGLRFKPRIAASTSSLATRRGGAALRLAIRDPAGSQAGIRAISVGFPRQLSPRLSAIQAACGRDAFAADPSTCPAASVVGTVKVRTPILDVPLRGPAYLVSRGTDALPRIVLMPQGRGIVLRLAGSLRIARSGIAVAHFASLPDAPIASLLLNLPRGGHSALGANFLNGPKGSLCARRLAMPVRVLARNGAVLRRSVRVAVRSCGRRRPRSRGRCGGRCGASPAARRQAGASSR